MGIDLKINWTELWNSITRGLREGLDFLRVWFENFYNDARKWGIIVFIIIITIIIVMIIMKILKCVLLIKKLCKSCDKTSPTRGKPVRKIRKWWRKKVPKRIQKLK
ncbi:hypothetical protein [Gray Lodge virus]|uniref:Uncharacterized protein n=1 Tax=Gray Lodge virus TaxID=1272942 RepID=A0A0D3R1I5_9RHAB|nr:hypothetical protein [Gray Lodge virus]AJR28579.1 hypothetical protein [Gray Lodge virus]